MEGMQEGDPSGWQTLRTKGELQVWVSYYTVTNGLTSGMFEQMLIVDTALLDNVNWNYYFWTISIGTGITMLFESRESLNSVYMNKVIFSSISFVYHWHIQDRDLESRVSDAWPKENKHEKQLARLSPTTLAKDMPKLQSESVLMLHVMLFLSGNTSWTIRLTKAILLLPTMLIIHAEKRK